MVTKGHTNLKTLQVCLSTYDLFLPPIIKALSERKCHIFFIVIQIAVGGERWKTNAILTSFLFPGYVRHLVDYDRVCFFTDVDEKCDCVETRKNSKNNVLLTCDGLKSPKDQRRIENLVKHLTMRLLWKMLTTESL